MKSIVFFSAGIWGRATKSHIGEQCQQSHIWLKNRNLTQNVLSTIIVVEV